MTREDFLKKKISEKNTTLKAIAADIGVPYSTLRDMQANVGSARVDNVILLCNYLGITVEQLNAANLNEFAISDFEKKLILAYRDKPIMHNAVNKLLNLDDEVLHATSENFNNTNKIQVQNARVAACGGGTFDVPATNMSKEELDRMVEESEIENELAKIKKNQKGRG